jgi:hypothetical protein
MSIHSLARKTNLSESISTAGDGLLKATELLGLWRSVTATVIWISSDHSVAAFLNLAHPASIALKPSAIP